ncbi:MAG: DNA helicase RecG, partial [Acidimicrobiales bacterium]|nr:DNA helicase RecG [Acidimicrobiales bacterium]
MTEGRKLGDLAGIPVRVLDKVGEKREKALADMGITNVLELLTHYPRRYIDRTNQTPIAAMKVGEEGMVLGRVKRVQSRRTKSRMAMVEVDVFDGSSYLHCVFFNQPWRAKQLTVGTEAVLFGKLDVFKDRRQMTNPVVDLIGDRTGRVVPVYPQSGKAGLSTWELAGFIEAALGRAKRFADPLTEEWRDRLDLADRTWAFNQIHNPESTAAAQVARRRLVVDELLRLQLA